MDELDLKIVRLLKDGVEISKIQKQLNISRQAVYYRIKKLKEDIKLKETVTADLEKLGFNSVIVVLAKWKIKEFEEFYEKFRKYIVQNPHVCLASVLLGEWDTLIIFACRSHKQYREVLREVYKGLGDFISEWRSIPITSFETGGVQLPDVDKALEKEKSS